MVLGAGLSGVTTAWYLAEAGMQVTVIDRQPQPGLETSYANGGQISVSHPEPWSSPTAPLTALRSLGQRDAPLRLQWRLDPLQWRWALAFLLECLPARHHRNTAAIAALARYSLDCLHTLRERCDLSYEQQTRGILHLFHTPREWRAARTKQAILASHGIHGRLCSPAQCTDLEPALHHLQAHLSGGFYAPDDESGNARLFTQGLAERCRARGVRFHHGFHVDALHTQDDALSGVTLRDAAGQPHVVRADAYVLCLGSHGPRLMAPLGDALPIFPLKGYSVTVPVRDGSRAPHISLTDESRRIVCSRLGEHLRIAGTAELGGYETDAPAKRCRPLLAWVEAAFPGATDLSQASLWAGLRPATPGNLPLIGRSRHAGLWYNTGHGSLGWTLACGSASSLARLMQGEAPPVAGFPFQHGQRY